MPVYVVLAALAVCLSVPLLWLAVASDRAPSRQINRNLTAGLAGGGDLRSLVLSESPLERVVRPAVHALGRLARRVSPSGAITALGRRVELAGLSWPVERFLVMKLVLAGGLLVGGLVMASLTGSSMTLLLAVAGAVVGYLAPDVVLSRLGVSVEVLSP